MKTYTPKAGDIERAWHVIDAEGKTLGRLASEVAQLLKGKHKVTYAPHLDTGDYVVVVNADKLALTPQAPGDQVLLPAFRLSGRLPQGGAAREHADAPDLGD